jgi:hypothetical protein
MTIIRWWQSKVNMLQIWSLVELALPIMLLTDFVQLGFPAKTAAWIVLIVKLLNVAATMVARNKTTAIVVDKATMEAAQK